MTYYEIESIDKERCWLIDGNTGLTFEVYYDTDLQVNEDGIGTLFLDIPAFYMNTNEMCEHEIVELIDKELQKMDVSEEVNEMLLNYTRR